MARRRQQSIITTMIKWIISIFLVIVAGRTIRNFFTVTDVTNMVNMNQKSLEETLNVTFTPNPGMVSKIYAYTNGEVTVDSSDDNHIAIVYIDGEQCGLHIDNKKYSMFGVNIGDSMVKIEHQMNYIYQESYEVLDDMYQGSSTARFFTNKINGDCLILVANDLTNRVVAITYFRNEDKALERLV